MLYLIATPIGNLGDITYRAVDTLQGCDEVWCEDTRQTAKLLNHLGIKKPLISCHEYTQKEKAPQLLEKLKAGLDIVYVSDAGMPGISDPGAVLVQACIEADLPYSVLPGPSAVLTAAVLSGLPLDRFAFFGFLPREGTARKKALSDLVACGCTAILYESPHRVRDTLNDVLAAAGDCPCALVRELTKVHECAGRHFGGFERIALRGKRRVCAAVFHPAEGRRSAYGPGTGHASVTAYGAHDVEGCRPGGRRSVEAAQEAGVRESIGIEEIRK